MTEQQENQYDLITRMNERYPKMSKGHKAIAAFIADHYDQAAFMTAAKLGEEVHVSESTVVRFAMGLGYEGYPEFQKALAEWVKDKLNTVQRIDAKYRNSTQSEILTSVLTSDMNNIADTVENLDPVAFEAAVDSILQAKHVYIVGIRSCEPLAEFLYFYLNMIRGDVNIVTTTSASETFEQMIRVNSEDVVIGISFPRYSMRTLKAMEFARDRNAKIITITDSLHSPMNLYSSCNLLAKSDMVSLVDSLVAPLSIVNALIVAIAARREKEISRTFANLERIWEEYDVYEKQVESE